MSDAASAPKLITLQKITVNYVAEEDRLKLTAAAHQDQTVIYWLTRRMLGVLLTPMFEWLNKRVENSFGGIGEGSWQLRSQETKLTMASNAAQAKMHREEPVIASAESIEQILKSVDVRAEKDRFLILLPIDNAHRGVIPFEQDTLLQWLGIIYRVQHDADWRLPQWPSWFIENQTQTKQAIQSAQTALH